MKLGGINIDPVLDGRALEPRVTVVARDDEVGWDCPAHPLDEQGRLALDLGGFLVRTGTRTILVDAGMGTVTTAHASGGQLPSNLHRLGVGFDEVTDVVFTHLHFDHVGWATQRGKITFPRATYRVHADDWEHFVSGPSAVNGAIRKLSPLEPQLETFVDEEVVAPGVVARHAPGHTPGSTVFFISDRGERALLLGDVAHSVAELTDPEWHGLYDLDPEAARAVRDRLVNEAAAAGDAIAAAHFPGLKFGRLVTSKEGRSFSYL
jgi:glyoxylase-like metal-dependent hydrolase (beta-lactamase superfamily II)